MAFLAAPNPSLAIPNDLITQPITAYTIASADPILNNPMISAWSTAFGVAVEESPIIGYPLS